MPLAQLSLKAVVVIFYVIHSLHLRNVHAPAKEQVKANLIY